MKWFSFQGSEPSDNDGDFFVVRGELVSNGEPFAEIVYWSGACFMSIEDDGESFHGPVKIVHEWRPLSK